MRNIKRLLRREDGVALVMVLAFMALAVPVVTAALGLASSLSIDSRVKADIARDQFAQIGANEFALDILGDDGDGDGIPDVLEDDTDGDTIPDACEDDDGDGFADGIDIGIDLNGETVDINIACAPPGVQEPPDGEGLVTTKTVLPTTAPEESSTASVHTYDIVIENTSANAIVLTDILDGLPPGFSYKNGTTLINGSAFADPVETTLWYDEADTSGGGKILLEWDVLTLDILMQQNDTVTLSFDAEATDLVEGFYCNSAWTLPEGSQSRTHLTARIEVGSPSDSTCVGEEVTISGDVDVEPNPNDDPNDPNDDLLVTYTIVIQNDGPDDLDMWWLRDKLPPGFTYKWNTTTGDFTNKNPFAITLFGRQRLNWFFLFPAIEVDSGGGQRTLIFQAVAPTSVGIYYNEVWAFFVGFDDDDASYSWPSSLVMMADVYNITVDGEPTSQVWLVGNTSTTRRWEISR